MRRSLGIPFRFVELANDINEHMPDYVVRRLMLAFNRQGRPVNGAKILLLGLAYKRNTGDAREAPGTVIAQLLAALGAEVRIADPHLHDGSTAFEVVEATPDLIASVDAVVVVTDHDALRLRDGAAAGGLRARHPEPARRPERRTTVIAGTFGAPRHCRRHAAGVRVRVLVTGGAGFIGANLCRALATENDVTGVVALDDLSTGFRENLDTIDGVELVVGSILDHEVLDEVTSTVDAVVHLGARPSVPRSLEDPMASHDTNATGTVAVLEAARRHGGLHVVVASSSSVYGANPALPKREDMACMPVSPYAASKLATESYALAYARSFGLPVLAYRFFNVFGPLAAGRARLRRGGACLRVRARCAASPCPSTATGSKPVTSPTWAAWSRSSPRPSGAR